MGQFNKELSKFRNIEEDEWRKFFLRKEKDEAAEVRALFGVKKGTGNLSNPSYLNAINSRKQEAVFKIIPGANVGRNRITTLARYVTRRLEHQKDEQEIQLYDSLGRELKDEEIEKKLNKWVKSFEAPKGLEKQQWKIDTLGRFEDERTMLQEQDLSGFTPEELSKRTARLEELNKFIKGKYYEKPDWFQKIISDDKKLEKVLSSRFVKFTPIEASTVGFNKKLQFGINHDTPKKIDLNVKVKDDFKHLLFSPGGKHNSKVLKTAFKDFVGRTFEAQGYEVMYALHQDTDNDHFHVILKATSRILNKDKEQEKGNRSYFHPDIADLHALREEFAYSMSKYGITRVATKRKDRPETLKLIRDGVENLKQSKSWYDAQLEPQRGKPSYNVIKAKASMLKNIEFLKRQEGFGANLKAVAKGQSAEYDADRKVLRELKEELLKPLSAEQVRATMQKFEEQHKQLSSKLQSVAKEQANSESKKEKKQLARKRSSFELLENRLVKDVDQAILELKKSRTRENASEINNALKRLKEIRPAGKKLKLKR